MTEDVDWSVDWTDDLTDDTLIVACRDARDAIRDEVDALKAGVRRWVPGQKTETQGEP